MFVGIYRRVLQKVSQHSQFLLTGRCFYSSNKHLSGVENTESSKHGSEYRKSQWEKDAERYMSNLSEEDLQKKKKLEIMFELMRGTNKPVPKEISLIDWMMLIRECSGYEKTLAFIEYLNEKEQIKAEKSALKQEIKKKVRDKAAEADLSDSKQLFRINRMKYISRWKGVKSLLSDIDVIVDLGFDSNLQAQRGTYVCLEFLLLNNIYHLQPLKVHFTSVEKNFRTKSLLQDNNRVYASLHKKHFLDIFPHKDLVYLTPDGPSMRDFDSKCTYVIGGLGKFGNEKFTTLDFAKKHGLRYASFPIHEYFDGPRIDLRLSDVHCILLEMYLHGSWKEAFIKHLPYMFTLRPDKSTPSERKLREKYVAKTLKGH